MRPKIDKFTVVEIVAIDGDRDHMIGARGAVYKINKVHKRKGWFDADIFIGAACEPDNFKNVKLKKIA